MPTGYTDDIKNGISFERYALNCARAFGACISIRDEPGGGEQIPAKFEPSNYEAKALETAQRALCALFLLTPEQCERRAAKDWDDKETRRITRKQQMENQLAKYRAMLEEVNRWKPPTPEHEELHTFMRTQIEESIRFDCSGSYYETPSIRQTGAEWLAAETALLTSEIERRRIEHAKEVQRANDRTAWVAALRRSL